MKKEIKFKFLDKSSWVLSNEQWKQALLNKLKVNKLSFKEFHQTFLESVALYFKKKKVLTKFGDEDWEQEYKNMGDLAEDMMYGYIRASLMGLVLAGSDGKVLAITDDGKIIEYGKSAKKTSLKNVLTLKKL